MKITLQINPSDIDAIAEFLNTRSAGECCPAQFEAIAMDSLTRIVSQAAIMHGQVNPATSKVVSRDYDSCATGKTLLGHRLPKARRTV